MSLCTDQAGKFFADLQMHQQGLLSPLGKAGIVCLRQKSQETELRVSSLGRLKPPHRIERKGQRTKGQGREAGSREHKVVSTLGQSVMYRKRLFCPVKTQK